MAVMWAGGFSQRLYRAAMRSIGDRKAEAAILCLASFLLLPSCTQTYRKKPAPPSPPEGEAMWAKIATTIPQPVRPGQDSDGDSIPDERERALGSDPHNLDTDKDGFDDGFEDMLAEFGFDPLAPSRDSDQDGLEDGFERQLGTNPENPDSDGDGWGDFDETLNRFYGYDPLAATVDADFDGLADELEKRIGSSPAAVDTNGDGVEDFPAYTAGVDPAGPKIKGGLGELIGTTYSAAMKDALMAIRAGRTFPEAIASELPYPRITRSLVTAGRVKPSAALMQRSVYNPSHSPGIYPPYNDIVSRLYTIAGDFDGSPGPDIVRLFQWSERTVEERERPGRIIYAMKISDNPGKNETEPEVLFMGVHHARELLTATNTLQVITDLTKGYAAGDPEIRKRVDNAEIWVMPVVNPNGYERAVGPQLDWRKNTHKVTATQAQWGVDLNRNYGFEHATSLTIAQRAALNFNARWSNGIASNGNFDVDSPQYPGPGAFSEVETQAVRGLAHNQFLTETRDEVDGLICSLSWHTYSGVVGHPMAHKPSPPNTGLSGPDKTTLGTLTDGVAIGIGSGYKNIRDTFPDMLVSNGDPINGYPVYGDSDDWLYKDGHTFSLLVEAFSTAEGWTGSNFYPTAAAQRDAASAHNFQGALALIRTCRP